MKEFGKNIYKTYETPEITRTTKTNFINKIDSYIDRINSRSTYDRRGQPMSSDTIRNTDSFSIPGLRTGPRFKKHFIKRNIKSPTECLTKRSHLNKNTKL